jgi:hypothetical protein
MLPLINLLPTDKRCILVFQEITTAIHQVTSHKKQLENKSYAFKEDEKNLKESNVSKPFNEEVIQDTEKLHEESSAKPHFVSFDHYLSCCGYNTADLPLSRVFKPQPLLKGTATTVGMKRNLYSLKNEFV